MKKFQSFEDFAQALGEEKVPDIDINMIKQATVHMPTAKAGWRSRRLIIATLAALLILCLGTAAFAADTIVETLKSWYLRNNKGEVVLQYTEDGLSNAEAQKWQKASEVRARIAEIIKPQLQKGEGAIFVTPETNGFVEYEEYIDDIDLLKQQSSIPFKTPAKLPAGYKFKYGKLSYEYDSDLNERMDELIQKAKESPEGYTAEKIKLKPEVKEITLRYHNGTNDIYFYISQDGILSSRSRANYQTEVLKIGDKEVLHNWYNDKYSGIYFMVDEYNDQKWLYNIHTNGSLTKDEVTDLIDSMEF